MPSLCSTGLSWTPYFSTLTDARLIPVLTSAPHEVGLCPWCSVDIHVRTRTISLTTLCKPYMHNKKGLIILRCVLDRSFLELCQQFIYVSYIHMLHRVSPVVARMWLKRKTERKKTISENNSQRNITDISRASRGMKKDVTMMGGNDISGILWLLCCNKENGPHDKSSKSMGETDI